MQTITTIGLDIAKSVFQVHGVDAAGQVVIRRQLKRRYVLTFFQKLPSCLVGIEACASSHHWSRELKALGHTVRLMPPAYVKPYVKRQKNDATDAEAICEAVTRANMRFVETKTPEQQSCLMLHRTRHLFIRQQTAVINAIRAHLAELGIIAPVGRKGVEELLDVVADPDDKRVPEVARVCLAALGTQLRRLKQQILEFDRAMIPLGSCTMKLNATSEMIPITFSGFGDIHPYAPPEQVLGYRQMFEELERWLAEITGYDAVSLQPNSGAQGEYAGLLAIRKYHQSRGDQDRTVCLIPSSATEQIPHQHRWQGWRSL